MKIGLILLYVLNIVLTIFNLIFKYGLLIIGLPTYLWFVWTYIDIEIIYKIIVSVAMIIITPLMIRDHPLV